ncbi:uncharacterized protein LOC110264842 [Arachis ipaensis]|uniref:uncharacterized protein LOC110264842 n=1 Tax=Arachis ipaensis TaxID=130454 RepID=UPI000A2B127B|nr:uncharacterized protein LOC110264842 [Arachis ipaensis]
MANLTQTQSQLTFPSDRGSWSRRRRGDRFGRGGRSSNQGNRPQCQLCGCLGHVVQTCFHRLDPNFQAYGTSSPSPQPVYPYSNTQPPPPSSQFHQSRAYFSNPNLNPESVWYLDSGASHHVTPDSFNLLHSTSSTPDSDQLFVGNGQVSCM